MPTTAFDIDSAYNELRSHFQGRVRRQEPLARHCAFGVGGVADIWVSLETIKELRSLVSLCAERRWPVLIVGNSTNVLYADAGVRGIVARIALSGYRIEEQSDSSALLVAEAGVGWPRLMHELAPLGWGGLEFGVGIPGTLGGGVISNAGAHNSELGRVLEWIEVLDARGSNNAAEGEISYPIVRRYQHDELDLGYRYSRFRAQRQAHFDKQGQLLPAPRAMIEPSEIIMLLGIHLHREDPQKLHTLINEHKQYRRQVEPSQRHAGTIFKDPPANEADKLIEQAGLKGKTYGKAQISDHNANYIVNLGGASATDIAALITEAHQHVLEQFGVNLELDVELRGEW
jgi:UDP-N-acetylmuramate dehydrogenase